MRFNGIHCERAVYLDSSGFKHACTCAYMYVHIDIMYIDARPN